MKYIDNIKSLLCAALILMAGVTSFTSCKDWLDIEKEAEVPDGEAFKNFKNFQGYIEEIYGIIPNKEQVNYCTSWNWGDDAVHNPEGYAHMDHQVDLGNYRNWTNNSQSWFMGSGTDGSYDRKYSLWKAAWYSIRKCNLGIQNIGKLIGTDDERDYLLGQMYFFRAWWHFELMCYFGGLPYIDQAFEAAQIPELPRLSFQECADRCAKDFEMAYNLLPLKWDETLVGSQGSNELRVNQFTALCYLGKVYLWAGSPLMEEFEKSKDGGVPELLGASANGKTYVYNKEYCQKAAETLGKALDMVARKQVDYRLVKFRYSNIYDHEKEEAGDDDEPVDCYCDIFYTVGDQWKMPGSTEAIMRGSYPALNGFNWNCSKIFGPKVAGLVAHDNIIHHPTANLVDQYGMANGQPIYLVQNGQLVLNPESGWDPEYPFKDRDPRFYHDIIFDGFKYVLDPEPLTAAQKAHQYCTLYTGGAMRSVDNGSSTGYFIQKLVPHQCNEGDKMYDYGKQLNGYIPYMRLADVYLMYAEARAGMATSPSELQEKPNYCVFFSAEDAINALRDRASSLDYPLAHVQPQFLATRERFIDEVRRERAVELSFEGFRWCDLQRWLLLTEKPYTVKYSHEFERVKDDSWYTGHDPKEAPVANFHREDLITRRLESKHYWFPLPDKDTYLYEGFPQNPGW